MRIALLFLNLVWLGMTVMPGDALAFGTIYALGQNGEHERITRLAMAGTGMGPNTLNLLAGNGLNRGATGYPDKGPSGMVGNPAAHCDGADHLDVPGYPRTRKQADARLEACRRFILDALEEAVSEAGKIDEKQQKTWAFSLPAEAPRNSLCALLLARERAKCRVLAALGRAFHTAQDFYAHSNWVDEAASVKTGPDNPPGLGQRGKAPFLNPRRKAPLPGRIITGCISITESAQCFSINGMVRVSHYALNKDNGEINVSTGKTGRAATPRGKIGDNFGRAVEAAIADTRDKWDYFVEEVLATYGQKRGRVMVCRLLKDDVGGCG